MSSLKITCSFTSVQSCFDKDGSRSHLVRTVMDAMINYWNYVLQKGELFHHAYSSVQEFARLAHVHISGILYVSAACRRVGI